MANLTGIVYIKVNGELLRSLEGATLMLGGYERTMVVGHKVYGNTQKVVPSTVTFEIAHAGGDDLIGIQALRDATLEFETDSGDTYMVRNAVATKPAELTGGDGKASFEFQGDPAELT